LAVAHEGQLVVLAQFLSQIMLINIQQTKLEVVHLTCLVEVNLVKEENVVSQGDLETHFVHTLNKLSEI